MSSEPLYYIIKINNNQHLIHRKGYKNAAFGDLLLRTFKNEDMEINLLCRKDTSHIYIPFGKSDKLIDILTTRGVKQSINTIQSANNELNSFVLSGGDELKINEITRESGTSLEYNLKGLSGTYYKGYAAFTPKDYVNEEVEFLFEGSAVNNKPPQEVKDFISSQNAKKSQDNMTTIIIFILILIVLAWIMF
ncbi:MAG: hypothetical protein ACNS60_10140 [Candidatus Cyclobacteriaceae bacterium M2_1C_046]